MMAEKTSDDLVSEIFRELSSLEPEDLDRLLRSWKATKEANKDNGDWRGYHFILVQ